MNIIFGPVQSRRFGESLGVDLSPYKKQCNYDCLYCELGKERVQGEMSAILEVGEILEAIEDGLRRFPKVQSLTITANGEPTLYPHLYELMLRLEDIKGDKETLLLTNGSLLYDICVARACLLFDKVKFSLDAVTKEVFKKIDRPHKQIDLEQILRGIYQFCGDFRGELYAEILFVKGVNDDVQEIQKMAQFLAPLPLKRLDIGSIDRPPAYRVESLLPEDLERVREIFVRYGIPVFVPKRTEVAKKENLTISAEEILKTLALRPMSIKDVQSLWSIESQEILKSLILSQRVQIKVIGDVEFYVLTL